MILKLSVEVETEESDTEVTQGVVSYTSIDHLEDGLPMYELGLSLGRLVKAIDQVVHGPASENLIKSLSDGMVEGCPSLDAARTA